MRTVRLTAVSFIFAAIFAVSAFAQTPAPATGPKVMFINTLAFEAKDGITKYINAATALDNEFKPLQTEIQTLATKYQNLAAEIKKIQDQLNATGGPPIDRNALAAQLNTKGDEYQNLELTIKRKQEDGKARLERRQTEVMGPVMRDIGNAIQEFAKQKGYGVILDAAKLENAGLILAYDDAKADVTKEFITFFNARGPATAATTKPE
jgi:Skp family chaperone for outer membrane proteins